MFMKETSHMFVLHSLDSSKKSGAYSCKNLITYFYCVLMEFSASEHSSLLYVLKAVVYVPMGRVHASCRH